LINIFIILLSPSDPLHDPEPLSTTTHPGCILLL
jgi:hypothetical protein